MHTHECRRLHQERLFWAITRARPKPATQANCLGTMTARGHIASFHRDFNRRCREKLRLGGYYFGCCFKAAEAAGGRAGPLRISGSSASKVAHPAAGSPAGGRSASATHYQLCEAAVAGAVCAGAGAGPNGSSGAYSAATLAASIHAGPAHSPPVTN